MLKFIKKNTKSSFNVTKWPTILSPIQLITHSPTLTIKPTTLVTFLRNKKNSIILSPKQISLLRITKSNVQYYYTTTNSTLTTTSIEKEQKEEKGGKENLFKAKSRRDIKEENVEKDLVDNSWVNNSLGGSIIKFREAIQEDNLEKLLTAHYALKVQEWRKHNYLTKSDYQEAIKLLRNSFTQVTRPSNPGFSTSTVSLMYSLFNDMKKQGYKPDTSIYNTLIYINARKGDIKESRRIYEMMLKDEIKCSLYTFNILISSYQWSLDIEGALKIFEEMKLYGIKPDTITYNSLIDLYVKLGDIGRAEQIYKEMKSNNTTAETEDKNVVDKFTFDCLLSGYLSYGQLDKAKKLFEDITNSGIELDIYLYTKLLKIYCYESGNLQKVLNLFNQISQQKTENNNYFVNTLLGYLIKEKEFSHILKIYEKLMDNGFICDEVTLTVIIPAYYHVGNIDFAFELFKEKMIFFTKNQKIFSLLFSNLGKEHSKNFLYQFTFSSSEIYNSLITYFLKQDDIIDALEIYSHLLQQGYFLNIMNITILCKKLILQGKINEALQIYYQSKDNNIILDQRGYTILIDSFSKMSYMSEAQRIFVDMKGNGIKPNSYTYSSLIRGLGKIYDIQGVKTIHQLIRMDLNLDQIDIITYNSLMDAYNRCGYGDNVLQLWDSLVNNDLSFITNTTVSIVLDSCGFNRELFRLNQIWYDLKKMKFNLNQNNYTSYIEALARNQKFNEAKNVLMFEMINDGIIPNSKTIRTLLNFLHDHSKGRDQFEIIKWVKTNFPVIAKDLKLVNRKIQDN